MAAKKSKDAAKDTRKKQGIIEEQATEDRSLHNKQYYQDISKRTEVQNIMRMLDENQRKADMRAEAQAAVTGATPEQLLASREVNRKTYADSLADVASNASMLRDQYLREYSQGPRARTWAQRLGMQDQLAAINANMSNQFATASTNAINSGAYMLGNGLNGVTSKAPQKTPTAPNINPQNDYITPTPAAGSTLYDPNLNVG